MDDLDLDLLEPLLRQLVDLVGLADTMTIVDRCGGTALFIAREPGEGALLTSIIGPEKAKIVGRALGTARYLIPKAGPAMRELRDRRILADLREMSVREVARKYRLGERNIWKIQRRAGQVTESRNLPLFG